MAEKNAEHTAEGIEAVSRYLLWNEVPVETDVIKTRGVTPELLASTAQTTQKHRADLCGHSQMRERLFGGCAQFFIRNAEQPVLLDRITYHVFEAVDPATAVIKTRGPGDAQERPSNWRGTDRYGSGRPPAGIGAADRSDRSRG